MNEQDKARALQYLNGTDTDALDLNALKAEAKALAADTTVTKQVIAVVLELGDARKANEEAHEILGTLTGDPAPPEDPEWVRASQRNQRVFASLFAVVLIAATVGSLL